MAIWLVDTSSPSVSHTLCTVCPLYQAHWEFQTEGVLPGERLPQDREATGHEHPHITGQGCGGRLSQGYWEGNRGLCGGATLHPLPLRHLPFQARGPEAGPSHPRPPRSISDRRPHPPHPSR